MPNAIFPGLTGGAFSTFFQEPFFEQEPRAALVDVFRPLGITGTSPFANFLQQSFNRYYNDYLSRLPYDPSLTFRSFLRGLNPVEEFRGTAPRLRGERPGFFNPRVRFI